MSSVYKKHFLPLESNPDVFNRLIYSLGSPRCLEFQDVLSLDDVDLLPHPTLALILIFPTTDTYERQRAIEDALRNEYEGSDDEEILWFKQTINNACGLYSILHALSNSVARDLLEPESFLAKLIEKSSLLLTRERSLFIEDCIELDEAYGEVARQGSSRVPGHAEDEVDFHFVCFVRSQKSGRLYELDGDRKGPIDRGIVLGVEEDLLAPGSLDVIRDLIESERGNGPCGLMALVFAEPWTQQHTRD